MPTSNNLILGNLTNLKAAVLPANLRSGSDWDVAIAALGKGVAASMQAHCNRLFERIAGDTFERAANCSYVSLPRFPVETVTALDFKSDETDGYTSQPIDDIRTLNKISGIVEFGIQFGVFADRIRLTYTGGFWADYTEDNSGSQPAGSTDVPVDLIHAWHLQVQHEIESTNLLRGVAAKRSEDKKERSSSASDLKLIERVTEMLKPFVRYS